MSTEWIVATVLLGIGIVAAVGLGLGLRDPSTRAYKPGLSGLLGLGRPLRFKFDNERGNDKDANRDGTGNSKP